MRQLVNPPFTALADRAPDVTRRQGFKPKIVRLAQLFHGLLKMRKIAPAAFALAMLGFAPAGHAGGYYSDELVGSVCGASCVAGQSEPALQLEMQYTRMYAHDPARQTMVIVNQPMAYERDVVRARY
jgi:hypothetical protein